MRISDWSSDVCSSDLTSGTTSHPKGVLHSHNSLMAELLAAREYWGIGASDVVLMPSPVTHITGYLYALEMGFVTGCAGVFRGRWVASEAGEMIQRAGVKMGVGGTGRASGMARVGE